MMNPIKVIGEEDSRRHKRHLLYGGSQEFLKTLEADGL